MHRSLSSTHSIRPVRSYNNQPFGKPALFEILLMEDLAKAMTPDSKPHTADHFELLWMVKGSGTLTLDLEKFTLQHDKIFCVLPGQVRRLQLSEDAAGYLVRFEASFLSPEKPLTEAPFPAGLLEVLKQAKNASFAPAACDELLGTVQQLRKAYAGDHSMKTEILRRYLHIFFLYMSEATPAATSDTPLPNARLVKKFMQLVEEHYRTKRRVSEYADLMLVTPNYLNETIKKITGNTAGHHIRERVVLEAKRQAAYSDDSMKEVAWNLGFSDIAHFSKFFKKITGNNFTDYKKNQVQQWGIA